MTDHLLRKYAPIPDTFTLDVGQDLSIGYSGTTPRS
jgi:hypothetical protein